MGAKTTEAAKGGVILIRLGVGREEYALPEGATLADLLRAAGVARDGHEVLIDGRPLEEAVALRPGMIVTLAPSSGKAWWKGVGTMPDDEAFRRMVEAGRAIREADREATIEAETPSPDRPDRADKPFWWDSVGMFRDDPAFDEMVKRVEEKRDSERAGS